MGADTTRIDLAKIEEKPSEGRRHPEIAPVKDTADDSSSSSSSSPGSAGWAKPAEPSGSVSAGRTESASKPFKPTPGNSATPAAAAGGGSGSSSPLPRPRTA